MKNAVAPFDVPILDLRMALIIRTKQNQDIETNS